LSCSRIFFVFLCYLIFIELDEYKFLMVYVILNNIYCVLYAVWLMHMVSSHRALYTPKRLEGGDRLASSYHLKNIVEATVETLDSSFSIRYY
jgi:hypothetical protein